MARRSRRTIASNETEAHQAGCSSGVGPVARTAGAAMSALRLDGVSKVYGAGAAQVHALRDVDLSVEPGELVAVMGPSGSGKSTLLTIAGSLEEPTGGEVLVGGTALSKLSRG